MNEVFLIGRVKDIKFEFMYESKYVSICLMNLKLRNKSIIKVYAHNEIADKMIQELRVKDIVFINGRLNSNGNIEISAVIKFDDFGNGEKNHHM